MFTEIEQRAIQEKLEQLKRVKEGILTPQELAALITGRRVGWLRQNLRSLLFKYEDLPPEEQAYNIIYFDHMNIPPEHSRMSRVSPTRIRIESSNFCPYLQACEELGLDTRVVCKEVGEPSIQAMTFIINPQLRFSRNYRNLRPHHEGFCEEYIERVL